MGVAFSAAGGNFASDLDSGSISGWGLGFGFGFGLGSGSDSGSGSGSVDGGARDSDEGRVADADADTGADADAAGTFVLLAEAEAAVVVVVVVVVVAEGGTDAVDAEVAVGADGDGDGAGDFGRFVGATDNDTLVGSVSIALIVAFRCAALPCVALPDGKGNSERNKGRLIASQLCSGFGLRMILQMAGKVWPLVKESLKLGAGRGEDKGTRNQGQDGGQVMTLIETE